MTLARRSTGILASLLILATPASAQQYEILHAFQAPLADAKAPMVLAADNALYGTFAAGADEGVGAIFVTRPQADGSVTTQYLRAFRRSEGGGVLDALVEGHDGWLYGVAPERGAHGRGSVFKFHRVTGELVVLHAFSGPDGAAPRGSLVVGDDGNYYGTTTAEGAGAFGTVFKLTPAGVLTTLHAFNDGKGWGLLVQASDGKLYGANGAHYFRLALDGTRSVIHTLPAEPPLGTPSIPFGLVEAADGHLYAVTNGSPFAPVRFFRLTLGGAVTNLYTSENANVDGTMSSNIGLSVAPDGSLIGTLPLGGANDRGTLFRLTTTGTFTVLHTYTVQEGRAHSGIVRHGNGHYYGTTVEGSLTGHGMIYSVGFGGSLVVRHPFTPLLPYAPSAPPIEGPDGALYGTTIAGGIFDLGTVYRLTPAGITILHNFTGNDGAYPIGRLVLGSDGKFYGTTHSGGAGAADAGTIFRISPAGVHEMLHTFTIANGRNPTAGLTLASDGHFWGTTLRGGSADTGTIFKVSPAGQFSPVHSFVFVLEPFGDRTSVYPYAGLIQARDGHLYGTTYGRGGLFGGTVFRVTPDGFVTRLHMFTGQLGFTPLEGPKIFASLIEGSDGQLYGAACCVAEGGSQSTADKPQVFRMSTQGLRTTLREMEQVFAGVAEGSDGALYGTTVVGELFKIDSGGTFTSLKTLTEPEGTFPSGVRASGDAILGTTYAGGPAGGGVIFRFKRD